MTLSEDMNSGASANGVFMIEFVESKQYVLCFHRPNLEAIIYIECEILLTRTK